MMIEFTSHSDCTKCSLHATARHPGLPSRCLYGDRPIGKAVLFVGQSPGHSEDVQGKCFVGYTGQLLECLVRTAKLTDYADIYVVNACRCKPPQGADESQANMRACRDYLQEDVATLADAYDEVVIMALGAKACYSTMHLSSLGEALKRQGKKSDVFFEKPRVFCTYHPAILHPSREPGKVRAVETHFSLLIRYLQGNFIPNDLSVTPEVGVDVPTILPPIVTVDIETYGILEGVEQTVFHPVKSSIIDHVPSENQIITVSFAWREVDQKIRTALYVFKEAAHRDKIRKWFDKMIGQGVVCVGQNVKFDLAYLRYADTSLSYHIDPRRLKLDDTMLMSFLLYEQQPEKGLKELSTLFGIADYSKAKVTGKTGNAKSSHDSDLHYYNCLDSAATLILYEELKRRIADVYGANSPKLNATSAWMRNIILWDTMDLERNGSSFRVSKVQAFHDREAARASEILKNVETDYGIKLAGTGSDKPLRQLMLDCITEAELLADDRVEWTGKRKTISIGVENVNLVKGYLPEGRNKAIITLFQEYKERSKIVSTYTLPLLTNLSRGIMPHTGNVGMVYPSWYPVPMYSSHSGGSDEKAGGQIQGRFSCQKPARQTEPRSIRECSCSRWEGGKIVEYDVNQDHLRMAALVSGDPVLMAAYEDDTISIHTKTALTIFPGENPEGFKDREPLKYKTGKELNFVILFRGGPGAFRASVLEKTGVELDLDFCQRAIRTWYQKHHVYKAWQDQMIDLAARQGYLVLPTGWSRTFGIGRESAEAQAGEVCNFLHQTPCAQMLHSAQYKAHIEFLKRGLRSVFCLQIYDALFVDVYPGEEAAVDSIMDDAMTHPPLLSVIEKWVGRRVPWAYEKKEYKQ